MATATHLEVTLQQKEFLADTDIPIIQLSVGEYFNDLTDKEKKYAHYIERAGWAGARIILQQTTKYSMSIFDLIMSIFYSHEKLTDVAALTKKAGIAEEDMTRLLEYSAMFLVNLGNYKSFGDTKFLPRIPQETFEKVVDASGSPAARTIWPNVKADIYALEPVAALSLGKPDQGHVTNYYSADVKSEDVADIQATLDEKKFSPVNTRLFKKTDGTFDLRIASVNRNPPHGVETSFKTKGGRTVTASYGDFWEALEQVNENLKKAKEYAANDTQRKMLEKYIESFETGSIEAHIESQRHWVKDLGPVVESNIGFIEHYRDPYGMRSEWETFVAIVNKPMTEKFAKLVEGSPKSIAELPWGKDFEKDKFLAPDFTSLEVLSFATGGLPAGINIPNYDVVRQADGFKNVSLANTLRAVPKDQKISFLTEKDAEMIKRLRGPAFEVVVGLHELLGHGTGKYLAENEDGSFNFDKEKVVNPLTGDKVKSWYKPGQTWSSVFGSIAPAYEECRADSVAVYLCLNRDLLELFGHTAETTDPAVGNDTDIIYISYLMNCHAGLLALEFWDPKTGKHGQAHMQGRFAILRVLMEAGVAEIKIDDKGPGKEEESDILLTVHADKIETAGKKAMGEFLRKLQVYASTADLEGGNKLFTKYTTVPKEWYHLRDVVLAKKQPRRLFVQANTFLEGDKVVIKEYEPTLEGLVESFIERKV